MPFRKYLLAMGVGLWTACSVTSAPPASGQTRNALPSLSVFGFSCELGGQKCRDRRVGREMRALVSGGLEKTGAFHAQEEAGGVRKHLLDVSDMLWTSGESAILPDLVEHSQADFVAYGRVFHYDSPTRLLKVEVTLEHRLSGRKLSRIGAGSRGSLKHAVANAVENIDADLEPFLLLAQ